MTLSLVLVDDWELRGDGSGDMRRIQFDAMRKLNRIYEDHGLKGSYNAEIMQQLHHLRLGERHAELKELAQEWEEIVLETYKRGHDVQLHVHSQWSDASYQDGRWKLAGDWAIINHSRAEMVRMISQSRAYLEKLIRRVDPKYRCISFRAGAWAIAPSEHILSVLAEQGIVYDMSICGGIKYDNTVVKLDYTDCEETLLPFYPHPADARRVGNAETAIMCVPTFSFRPSRATMLKGDVKHIRKRLHSRLSKPKSTSTAQSQPAGTSYTVWQDDKGKIAKLWELSRDHLHPEVRIGDLSYLNIDLLKDMVSSMRRVARRRNVASVPIILENHSKNISNFDDIKRFAEFVSQQADLEVITLQDLARRLEAGFYPVVERQALAPEDAPAFRRASVGPMLHAWVAAGGLAGLASLD